MDIMNLSPNLFIRISAFGDRTKRNEVCIHVLVAYSITCYEVFETSSDKLNPKKYSIFKLKLERLFWLVLI